MAVREGDQLTSEKMIGVTDERLAAPNSEDPRLEPPFWHGSALQETVARYKAGQEHPLDWVEGKQQLRKRAK